MTMTTATRSIVDRVALEGARRGDRDAFDTPVAPLRDQILAHCYRMLGSIHDADDVLQDTMLRAWKGLPGFDGRAEFTTWLRFELKPPT